jgi:hypothetical protein
LREVKRQIGPIDILIDDGGHSMRQQIVTFEELYDAVREDGVYLCEDVHTSYWLKFGGGHRRRGTFIEYTKNLIDQVNAFHSDQRSLRVDSFTRTTDSIHYYDSIVVFEKRPRTKPEFQKSGRFTFEYEVKSVPLSGRIRDRFLHYTNRLLRYFRLGGFIWR